MNLFQDAYFTACLLTIALNAVEACVVQELNLDKDQEKFEIIFASVNAGLHLLIFGIVLIWIIRKVTLDIVLDFLSFEVHVLQPERVLTSLLFY